MYLFAATSLGILGAAPLAIWLLLIRPSNEGRAMAGEPGEREPGARGAAVAVAGVAGMGPWRVLAWLAWAAAALLAANHLGYEMSRDPTRPYANLEQTLALVNAWPVVLALVFDRLRAWRPRGWLSGTGGMVTSVLVTCAPQLLMLLMLAVAMMN